MVEFNDRRRRESPGPRDLAKYTAQTTDALPKGVGGTVKSAPDDFPPLSDEEMDEVEQRWQENEHPPSREQLKARNKARQKVGVDTEPLPPKPRAPRQPRPPRPPTPQQQVRRARSTASQLGKLARLASGGRRRRW